MKGLQEWLVVNQSKTKGRVFSLTNTLLVKLFNFHRDILNNNNKVTMSTYSQYSSTGLLLRLLLTDSMSP